MRILFVVIMGLHALIHLMGFVKAFDLAEIRELTRPVPKSLGVVWLLAFVIFAAAAIQFVLKNDRWWMTASAAVLVSQTLIIISWQDARFGTIPNVIILIIIVIYFAQFDFSNMIARETDQIMAAAKTGPVEPITAAMISDLPDPVQNWLMVSGVVGREPVRTVRLRQEVHLKMKPEQKDWTDARAEQYYSTDPPAFIWHVDMEMLPLIGVQGRDKFVGGRGTMLIKLLSLIPIVDESDNEKLNTGALQRYLGEIVWFPSAALSPCITWEPLDAFSARATMTYSGTTGSGTFFFNEKGDFEKFSALRWMGSGDEASQHEWVITVEAYRTMDGIRIPSSCRATWKLPDGDWTWLEVQITEISYNNAAGK